MAEKKKSVGARLSEQGKTAPPARKMTEQEKEEWDELYWYVHDKVMGYDESQCLTKFMILCLRGLKYGKLVDNRNIDDMADYSYKLILNTFKFCSLSIQRGLSNNTFKDEKNKFIYIVTIVESNLNNVYMRMKNKEADTKKLNEMDVTSLTHQGAGYQTKKKKKITERMESLW